MTKSSNSVLLVAGGMGTRMESTVPKQFLLLNGVPVLMHTIKRFYEFDPLLPVVIVLPESEITRWEGLVGQYSFMLPHRIVAGGNTRFQSVKNGLRKISDAGFVAIHDGVRPLCPPSLVTRCFAEAEKHTNAIPAVRVTDTVREFALGNNFVIDREKLRIIQTPQCFDAALIKKAYEISDGGNFTDDAGVFENAGHKIHLVKGEKYNIKITEQTDLLVAAALEKQMFAGR
jgi:2-C-methyl-D-erythritol 4-phosphate cytidylyltransferase